MDRINDVAVESIPGYLLSSANVRTALVERRIPSKMDGTLVVDTQLLEFNGQGAIV